MPDKPVALPPPVSGFNIVIGDDRVQRDLLLYNLLSQHKNPHTYTFSERSFGNTYGTTQRFHSNNIQKLLTTQEQLLEKFGRDPKNRVRVILDNTKGISQLYSSNGPLQILINHARSMNIELILTTAVLPVFHNRLTQAFVLPSAAIRNYTALGSGVYESQGDYCADTHNNVLIMGYADKETFIWKTPLNTLQSE